VGVLEELGVKVELALTDETDEIGEEDEATLTIFAPQTPPFERAAPRTFFM